MLFRDFARLILVFVMLAPSIANTSPKRDRSSGMEDPFTLGKKLAEEKKFEEARLEFEKAIQEDPSFLNAYLESARASVLSGKRKEGLLRIETAIQIAKKKADISRLKEQRKLFAEIFFTNSAFQKFQDGLNLMQSMKLRAAIEAFEQTLATEPDNVLVMIAYARALQAVDDWKESVNVLEQVFILNPDEKQARILLGKALLNVNQERTILVLKPLVANPSEAEDVFITYSQALAKLGENDKAIDVMQKVVDLHTDRVRSLFWLGKYQSDKAENRWMARKTLQTFLKRGEKTDQDLDDELRGLKQDARRILERINAELEIEESGAKQ